MVDINKNLVKNQITSNINVGQQFTQSSLDNAKTTINNAINNISGSLPNVAEIPKLPKIPKFSKLKPVKKFEPKKLKLPKKYKQNVLGNF